ncbi:sialoadhesin-like [Danio aesculapii]|uniref:sialoadhesin-like n=1 Tax=Danio aesculapii TaxID=1142201 RepID=UPI0024BFC229|nr:sialoadhesin-like [Danio aesculapii]
MFLSKIQTVHTIEFVLLCRDDAHTVIFVICRIAEVTMLRSFRASLPLILVIMTAGSDGQLDWGVNYSPSYVCALKGSTVEISCTVKYPSNHKLTRVFWTKNTDGEPPNLCFDPDKIKRVRRVRDYKDNKDISRITLTAVTEADKHIYYCRFTTNFETGKWTGIPGVQLDVTDSNLIVTVNFDLHLKSVKIHFELPDKLVTVGKRPHADLQVETKQSVKAGDPVTLSCKSSCSLPKGSTFLWYRNTERLTGETLNNQLHLQSVSHSDAGYYQCAVGGNEHLISPAVYVKVGGVDGLQESGVNYSPSYVCALKGSTVKISCTTYAGYKLIQSFSIKPAVTTEEPPDLCSVPDKTGRVQCVRADKDTFSITLSAVTEADKHIYYCRYTDTLNKRWTVIPGARLDVTDLQVETQQIVVEGDSVTLSCKSSCSLPEGTAFIWYRNTERLTRETLNNQLHLQSVNRSDAGDYRCAAGGNEHLKSPPVHLKVGLINSQQDWGVKYSSSSVCALKGSTVTMSCTSTRAGYYELKPAFWTKTIVTDEETQSLCSDPDTTRRAQCVSENKDTSNITLTAVTDADKHKYYCRFTDKWNKRWTVVPGVWLDVTDLQVETQQTVVEGKTVTLSCKSSCSLPKETKFIWYRNTERLTGETWNNQLHLQSVSHSDAGDYRCAARGNEHLKSPPVHLSVEYPPKSVSVSISGSAVIVSGDSVTLSCSSDSNPPAVDFRWFKVNQSSAVGSGQSFSISSFNSNHSGRYYCEAENKYGSQRSESVSVTEGVQRSALHTLTGVVVGCGGLIFIIIIIIIIVFICVKRRRATGSEDVKQKQSADSTDDTYTALDPASRRSADVYSTIPSVGSRAPDDETYTALELQSRSSEYETLHVAGASADPH